MIQKRIERKRERYGEPSSLGMRLDGDLVIFENQDGSLLADHVSGSLGMSIVETRQDRDIWTKYEAISSPVMVARS